MAPEKSAGHGESAHLSGSGRARRMTMFRPYAPIKIELAAASAFAQRGYFPESFEKLERAHILSQSSTWQHVRVHARMLHWAIQQRDAREGFGQLLRMAGAAAKTAIGLVPSGNTGGA